jgi:hypothetical protein
MQMMARRGFIPVTAVGEAEEFTGYCWYPAGWRAYAFVVPAKEKLHVRLYHTNTGWFRLAMFDKWGQLREGMLQNLIPTGNPEVSFNNPRDEAMAVYVLVDDPGWMSSKGNPFTLKVDRSWDPGKTKTPELPTVMGIWAKTKAEPTDLPKTEDKPMDKPEPKPAS